MELAFIIALITSTALIYHSFELWWLICFVTERGQRSHESTRNGRALLNHCLISCLTRKLSTAKSIGGDGFLLKMQFSTRYLKDILKSYLKVSWLEQMSQLSLYPATWWMPSGLLLMLRISQLVSREKNWRNLQLVIKTLWGMKSCSFFSSVYKITNTKTFAAWSFYLSPMAHLPPFQPLPTKSTSAPLSILKIFYLA